MFCFIFGLTTPAHGAKLIKFNVFILAGNGPSYILKNLLQLYLHVSIK